MPDVKYKTPKDDPDSDNNNERESSGSEEQRPIRPTKKDPKWKRDYFNLTEKDRAEMLVDETFGLYLYRTSQRVNEEFYKTVLAYVIFFRECLDEIGWNKRIESENINLQNEPAIAEAMEK